MKTTDKYRQDPFFNQKRRLGFALTYEDLSLKTGYSEHLPTDLDVRSRFTTRVPLNIPLVASPMDTVTGFRLAISLATDGGIGIIDKSLSPENQAAVVSRVKSHLHILIKSPVFVRDNMKLSEVIELREKMKQEDDLDFYSFPVLSAGGKLVGSIGRSTFDFSGDKISLPIKKIMSRELITGRPGTTIKQAYAKMIKYGVKMLPIVNSGGELKGMYTLKDAKRLLFGNSGSNNVDAGGNLRVGAAVSVCPEDLEERLDRLSRLGIDVIVIDTAHGDSKNVMEAVKYCLKYYPDIDIMAGNVSEPESVKRLIRAGVHGVRVGQGGGSICTTRKIAGIGCPQGTAVHECAKAARGSDVPICADGGIVYSGHITIALALGASSVMIGKLFAGVTESLGKLVDIKGVEYKTYRGMGSLGAMKDYQSSRERYGQGKVKIQKLVPEGIEGFVLHQGPAADQIIQLVGGLRSGMGYVGAKDILTLQRKARFHHISVAGVREGHPHDILLLEGAPNYHV